jgi:hypothetical protein
MQRCIKLHNTLDHINACFKLLKRKSIVSKKNANLDDRLLCAIKGFLTEHTMHPVQFKFRHKDQLLLLCKGSRQGTRAIAQELRGADGEMSADELLKSEVVSMVSN